VSLTPTFEDGNRSSFRNIMFLVFFRIRDSGQNLETSIPEEFNYVHYLDELLASEGLRTCSHVVQCYMHATSADGKPHSCTK
jgi:hypothetical protein